MVGTVSVCSFEHWSRSNGFVVTSVVVVVRVELICVGQVLNASGVFLNRTLLRDCLVLKQNKNITVKTIKQKIKYWSITININKLQ